MPNPTRRLLVGLPLTLLSLTTFQLPVYASPSPAPALAVSSQPSETPRAVWRVEGTVYASVVTAKRVYLGGDFAKVTRISTGRTAPRHNLVAFSRATGKLVRWRPSTSGPVRALAFDRARDRIVIGGVFDRIDGVARPYLGVVSRSTGALDQSWSGSTNGPVRDLLVQRRRLYLAGSFHEVDNQPQHGLGLLHVRNGGRVPSWTADVGGGNALTLALTAAGQSLIVGGSFSSLSGQPRLHLGKVSLTDGAARPWAPPAACLRCNVLDVAVDQIRVFAGTSGPGGSLLAYDAATGLMRWRDHANGDIQALAYDHKRVYIGGHFSLVERKSRTMLASVTSRGGLTTYRPRFAKPYHPGIWVIKATPDFLRVGGGFDGVGGRNASGYAEFRR